MGGAGVPGTSPQPRRDGGRGECSNILALGWIFQRRSVGLGSVMGAGMLTQQYRLPSLPCSVTSFLSHLPERLPALEFFTESVSGGAQTKHHSPYLCGDSTSTYW